MVLRGGCGRKKNRRNGIAEKVKWLGVIVDNRLDFKEHWRHRVGKARLLLRALGGVGNSKWGMSPISWRAAYTGMVCAVASWVVEIWWRGQNEWRQEMALLQNAAMRKALGAVKGSSGRKVNAIAAVEDLETFAKAATGRFLARTLCDPPRAGIGVVDEGIPAKGRLSFGGVCWPGSVDVVDLSPPNPPPLRYGNWRSGKLVNRGWWAILTAGETVMVESGEGDMLRGMELAASRWATSPLFGMGKCQEYVKHSGWPQIWICWYCLTQRQHYGVSNRLRIEGVAAPGTWWRW